MSKEMTITGAIENRIFTIREQKVMIDRDLAELYEVETKALNQAVKRNMERFPGEFMFKLTDSELSELVTICDRFKSLKHSSSTPYAFTEHGIAMLSSVLRSDKAVAVNIEIIKAFIKMRHYALSQTAPLEQIAELRKLLMLHIESNDNMFAEHELTIRQIIRVLNGFIDKPPKTRQIGFAADNGE